MSRHFQLRLFALLCACGLFYPSLGLFSAQLDRAVQFHGLAQGNYLIGDKNGALKALQACLRVDPNYLPALRLKAEIHLDKSELKATETTLNKGLKIAPEDPALRLLQALLFGQKGKTKEAMSQLHGVIKSTEADIREGRIARQLFGLLQMADGNWDSALEAFRSIPEDGSRQDLVSEAYLAKARKQATGGEIDAAIATLDQAIERIDPENSPELLGRHRFRLLRAQLLARSGRDAEARGLLEQLRVERPEDLEVALTLTSLYASNKQWSRIESTLPTLEGRHELKDIVLYFQGRVALAANRVGTARAKFEKAIDSQPPAGSRLLPSLLFYRGLCLHYLGRTEAAEAAILEAIDTGFRAETTEEAEQIAGILIEADRPELAVTQLEAAVLGRGRNNAVLWFRLARAHRSNGDDALAISALNQSLSLNPKQASALALRGSLLRKAGKLYESTADYKQAVMLNPGNSAPLYALGLNQLQVGQVLAAEQSLGLAVHSGQTDAGVDLIHATTAHCIGSPTTAKRSLERYFEKMPDSKSPTAHYLSALLGSPTGQDFEDLVIRYFRGKAQRKEVLDWAGRAATPAQAHNQICAAAYWLAQQEQAQGKHGARNELLRIAIAAGRPDNPEWQFANWQLAQQNTLP